MRKTSDYPDDFSTTSMRKRGEKVQSRPPQVQVPSDGRHHHHASGQGHFHGSISVSSPRPNTASSSYTYRNEAKDRKHPSNSKPSRQSGIQKEKPVESSVSERVDISKLSHDLTKMILQTNSPSYAGKRQATDSSQLGSLAMRSEGFTGNVPSGGGSLNSSKKVQVLDESQALQIKKILAECLNNFDASSEDSRRSSHSDSIRKQHRHQSNVKENHLPFASHSSPDPLGKTSLLRSYLSGSNPAREEYVSKRKNVSNSLISSDSIHHSIFLESGRERRQCLLQYLSNVVSDGQVVIYANSIPAVESLMNFLTKHGFQVNAVHQRMLMAESNWILSEFSLKKFSVLLCAEDHYHSCPAHFRWVKTIINYELPICNPLENWTIRNGIVEFSDNLPVHIYTFIKKTCPLDNELVKLLHLDSVDNDDENAVMPSMTEQVYSLN